MAGGKPGRKKIEYDPELGKKVQGMAQYGLPQDDIARLVGISSPVLRRLYRKELDNGVAVANLKVGQKLYDQCMAGDVTAMIFWAKTRMGWHQTQKDDGKNQVQSSLEQLKQAIKEAFGSVGN